MGLTGVDSLPPDGFNPIPSWGREGRFVTARALIVVATPAAAAVPFDAGAQAVPPVVLIGGDLAGRERQQFINPRTPRAQRGRPAIVLPSEALSAGAAQIKITIREVCIEGETIYRKQDLEPPRSDSRVFLS